MNGISGLLRSIASNRGARWIGGPLIVVAGGVAIIGQSAVAPPPTVSLAAEPLYARGARAKPTLSLALSVEFPTVGAQYRNATYVVTDTYIGYFDSESCYTYNNTATVRRFDRSGPATNHTCGGAGFSGNFMNWATGSAIDVLRYGLTGGDRVLDTSSETVLQRAVLYNSDFYNNATYFPSKRLLSAQVAGAVPAALATSGDIYIANCLNHVNFGTQAAGSCATPGNNGNLGGSMRSDAFFYARVKVCDSSNGVLNDPRPGLCLRYPSGNYKPVGNLQKYSDRLRIAAFGYLNDNTGNPGERYGGVLRAPMKYVGPKTFDANFALQSGTNAAAEWNENDGTFIANPQGQTSVTSGSDSTPPTTNLSGVINYLNQFGRTGTAGQYKTFDPVGELYYESLRYLQGLTPTPQAVSGLTTAMRDGYPVYDTWLSTDVPDPHPAVSGMSDYSCVKNNIVGIGDIFTHWDKSIPGNTSRSTTVTPNDFTRTPSDAANEPNFHEWTKIVGGFESNTSYTYGGTTSGNIALNAPYNTARWGMENQGTGSGSSSAYYMAGMAYWANTHDIRGTQWTDTAKRRPGMRVTTYMIDVNENSASNDTTTRTNSHFYLAAKYGGFKDTSGTGNPFQVLATDGSTAYNNSNWANSSGEAKNYFLASSSQALLNALDEIFANIASEANSIAGGAISTQRLTTAGGQIYQAQFDPADWSGDLVAYPVSVSASGAVTIGVPGNSPWRNSANAGVGAAGKLDDLASVDGRKIFVGYNSTAATPVLGVTEFKWNSLNDVTKQALRLPPYAAASSTLDAESVGQARLDYLRGDRTNETTGTFRRRGSRLGDIVNSGVAYADSPAQLASTTAYATFYAANKDRKKALYVGANDGMLHAFDAATGSELFAYIPSWLAPRLSALTSTSYVHAAYVDGSPEVAEALVGNAWKTVLVGGTAGGGQGVFALDVSDPDTFGADKVMWEFTDRHDPEIGNVIGHPKILKFNVAAGTTTPSYKYFAVFASGVNNYADDGYRQACAAVDDGYCGAPALFMLDLSKAAGDTWQLGTNYFKVRFPVKSSTMASGMSEFAVRLGTAGEVASIYAGDLQGNLWKLDFSATSAANWSLGNLSYFKDGSTPLPMFVAKDSSGNRQPITMEPSLAFGSARTIIVSFGTGKYLETSDNSGPYKAQSVYAVLDNNTTTVDSASSPQAAIAGRSRLQQATTVTASGVDFPSFAWGRPMTDSETTRSGWYFDFYNSDTVATGSSARAGSGERQVSNMAVLAGKLIFGTVIPALNSCDNGRGNLYIVDLRAGDTTTQASTVGILGEPFLTQVGASTLSGSDTTGRRTEVTRYQIILQGSAGLAAPSSQSMMVTTHPGRLSWREISNYQELRNGS